MMISVKSHIAMICGQWSHSTAEMPEIVQKKGFEPEVNSPIDEALNIVIFSNDLLPGSAQGLKR